jgi:hypothetical protein
VEDDEGLLCDGCDAVYHVACAGLSDEDVPAVGLYTLTPPDP